MKKISLFSASLISLISFAFAHTGNDYYQHGLELADWIIGFLIIIVLVLLVVWVVKRRKKRKG